ncbi:hypothetical protein IKI14_01765 [bacterium]|nr:hypothetical protein [bacterium]
MFSFSSLLGISILASLVISSKSVHETFQISLISHALITAIITANNPHQIAIIRLILLESFFLINDQIDANNNKKTEIIQDITHHFVIDGISAK